MAASPPMEPGAEGHDPKVCPMCHHHDVEALTADMMLAVGLDPNQLPTWLRGFHCKGKGHIFFILAGDRTASMKGSHPLSTYE
jgi:hypothetical protein